MTLMPHESTVDHASVMRKTSFDQDLTEQQCINGKENSIADHGILVKMLENNFIE